MNFKVQKPMYYASNVLIGVKTKYLKIDVLMIAARKLRHYFQAHPISVLTNQPLKQILQLPDPFGQLLKWSIKLSKFHINYRPRMAIKVQALANFITEFTYDVTLKPEVEATEDQN